MRIGVCSDIHVHRHEQGPRIAELVAHINAQSDLDLLICAGDLSHRTAEVRAFLESVHPGCPRAWVPGNHDVWVIDQESAEDSPEHRYVALFPAMSEAIGWHYLPSGPLVLPSHEIAVVGTTGWFTGEGYSEWFDAAGDDRDDDLARRFARELESGIEAVAPTARLVVVTHHLPRAECLVEGSSARAEFSRYLTSVVERHAARIALAVHGHKHRRYGPRVIEGVAHLAHPFGYPGQNGGVEDGLRVVEIA